MHSNCPRWIFTAMGSQKAAAAGPTGGVGAVVSAAAAELSALVPAQFVAAAQTVGAQVAPIPSVTSATEAADAAAAS